MGQSDRVGVAAVGLHFDHRAVKRPVTAVVKMLGGESGVLGDGEVIVVQHQRANQGALGVYRMRRLRPAARVVGHIVHSGLLGGYCHRVFAWFTARQSRAARPFGADGRTARKPASKPEKRDSGGRMSGERGKRRGEVGKGGRGVGEGVGGGF